MSLRRALFGLAALVGSTLALVLALEGVGQILLPAPPGPDTPEGRTRRFQDEFYEPDPDLVVRLRPNLATTFGPVTLGRDLPVRTNPDGFRGPAFPPPDPEALRILVLGDSITFGFALREEHAWPSLVAERLAAELAPRRVQVRNLAVPGYSSWQGRILCERHARGPFHPHIVVFAFGFNDGFLRPQTDAEVAAQRRYLAEAFTGRLLALVQGHALLRWLAQRSAEVPRTVRVPPAQLREHLRAVAGMAREGGFGLILADVSLPNAYPRRAFAEVAAATGTPLVEFRRVFAEATKAAQGRPFPTAQELTLVLDTGGVAVPASPDHRPPLHLLLLDDPEQRLRHRTIALHDDGRAGDAAAGDGRYSARVGIPAGATPEYCLGVPGLAATLPAMASDTALLAGMHFLPLLPDAGALPPPGAHPWPELVLLPDIIHPSEAGALRIAEAILAALHSHPAFVAFRGR